MSEKEEMKVSIIIPVKKINKYIRESVSYILKLDYENFEIIILPDKKTNKNFSKTKIIPTGNIGPAEKRDMGAKESSGEILAFLDDDAYPRSDWFVKATKWFDNNKIAAVGGPAVTPENDSILQKASGEIFSSFLGGGFFTYRYIPGKVRQVDDYPSVNFLIRKDIFEKLGGFDSHFWPGEDTKLCLDIVKKINKKIIYDPKVLVWHHRRKLFGPHLKQIANYATHRGYFAKKLPETSLRISYFIPSFFTLGIFFGLPFIFFNNIFRIIYFGILVIYGLALFITATKVIIKGKGWGLAGLTVLGIFLTHIIYGIFFIKGLLIKELKR